MTFALDAVAEPTHSPPRVALTATESDADLSIQSVAFFRDGAPLRFEAAVTGDEAIAYDYDAPFDVALLYRADATEIGSTVDWDETWPDLSEWAGDVGGSGWSVAAGEAYTGTSRSTIYRDAAGTIVGVSVDVPADVTLELTEGAGATVVSVLVSPDDTVTLSGTTSSMVDGSGAFTLTLSDDSVTLSFPSSTVTATVPYSGVPTRVQLTSEGGSVGEIEVRIAVDDPADVTASDTATLTGVEGAWLTNAAAPDLSILIDAFADVSADYFIVRDTHEQTELRTNAVTLEIEGSPIPLTVGTGPRAKESWTLSVAATTDAARRALLAALANDAPISLRFPATGYTELDGGFYTVGDLQPTRIGHPAHNPVTVVPLPLTPSRAPAYKPLWQWSWDTLVQTGMSWDDVAAAFATWNDVIVGPG